MLSVVLVAAAAACNKSAGPTTDGSSHSEPLDRPDPGSAPITDTGPAVDKSKFPGSQQAPARIELGTAGEQPRKALRLAPKVGQEQRLSTVITNKPDGSDAVTVRADVLARVTAVDPDGVIRVVTTFSEVSLPGVPRGELLAASIEKAEVVQTVTPQGAILSSQLSGAPEELVGRLIEQLTRGVGVQAHLPEQAVGLGASWTARSVRGGDDPLHQTDTYTLSSQEGSVSELSVKLEQRTESSSTHTRGEGLIRIDASKPLPVLARANGRIEIRLAPGDPMVVEFDLSMK